MSKCLCYKCDFSVIREWKRKSRANDQMLFALYIHCNWSNTDIVNDEQFDKKLFLTEQLIEMTCNRFDDKKFKKQKSKKF